jgi:hypothetical protein
MPATTIPFDGFYESCHNRALEDALNYLCADSSGDTFPTIAEKLFSEVDWSGVHEKYARLYADLWATILCKYTKEKITFEFDALTSPREYNFQTDRIFLRLSTADAEKLCKLVDHAVLAEVAKERFTSYDGFISHYSPRPEDWSEDVAEWDHNQLGTLLIAIGRQFEVPEDSSLIEDIDGNNAVTDLIYESLSDEGKRLVKIADYLRARQERAFR